MIFLFHEGTIGKDLTDSDLPQLLSHHLQIIDERLAPRGVLGVVRVAGSHDQQRAA
jgi:hypothetical protein